MANLMLTAVAFVVATAAAVLPALGRPRASLLALGALALALVCIPNDDCANPFNAWWIAHVGASPIMFVPVTFASLFSVAARVGIYPRLNAALVAALVLVTSGLGLGHFTRVIW